MKSPVQMSVSGPSIGDWLMQKAKSFGSSLFGDKNQPMVSPVPPPTSTPSPIPRPTTMPTPTPNYNSIPGYQPKGGTSAPQQMIPLIHSSAQKSNIDPGLLAALIHHESAGTWNPRITGPTGDYGLAEIVLKSHPDVTLNQAYDPNFAIPWAANYIRQNIDSFGGDINRGIAAYNVGKGGASVQGPATFGGGPMGQSYIDNVANNLDLNTIDRLGIKISPEERARLMKGR